MSPVLPVNSEKKCLKSIKTILRSYFKRFPFNTFPATVKFFHDIFIIDVCYKLKSREGIIQWKISPYLLFFYFNYNDFNLGHQFSRLLLEKTADLQENLTTQDNCRRQKEMSSNL